MLPTDTNNTSDGPLLQHPDDSHEEVISVTVAENLSAFLWAEHSTVTKRKTNRVQICCSDRIPNYLFVHKYFFGFGFVLLGDISPLAKNQLDSYSGIT